MLRFLACACLLVPSIAVDQGVKFSMRNLCGEEVRIYWISFDEKSLVGQSTLPVKNSSSVSVNSYSKHRFLVWYSKGRTEDQVQAEAWEKGTKYTVGDTNDIVTIEAGLTLVRHDAHQLALEAAEEAVRACDTRGASGGANTNTGETLAQACLSNYATDWLKQRRGELDFEWSVYRNLKAGLGRYSCASKAALALGNNSNGDQAEAAKVAKKTQTAALALAAAKVSEDAAAEADGEPRCKTWAFDHDQCKENPGYMLQSCAQSCKAFNEKQSALALDEEEEKECVNLEAVVGEGESELGRDLTGKGDRPTPRRLASDVVAKALSTASGCLALLKEAQVESLAAGPESLAAELAAEEAAAVEAAAALPSPGGGGLLSRANSWFLGNDQETGGQGELSGQVQVSGGGDKAASCSSGRGGSFLPALLPAGKAFAKCLSEHGLAADFSSVSREVSRVRNAKGKLAEPLRNQTCGDDEVGTIGCPEDVNEFQWVAPVSDDYVGEYDEATGTLGTAPASAAAIGAPPTTTMTTTTTKGGSGGDGGEEEEEEGGGGGVVEVEADKVAARSVTQLLNRNNAQVFLIDNFVTDNECNAMIDAATPGLRRSTVNEEGNNQAVSQYRNSQAANVMANWQNKSDPIARVVRRVFAFANHHTGYGLTVDGQEPFSVIQYLGGQEYRPHCDGSCDGSPHLHAGRVATMLMYCRVADSGGGTSFTKSGIHVKPAQGQAVFFSYRGENNTMDVELTEHSGCPVKAGTKWVVTQWLRSGVGKGESWTKFDPIGGRLT